MNSRIAQSQRDWVPQPRVAEPARLPWVMRFIFPQPQRGCDVPRRSFGPNPVGVDDSFDSGSQGSASCNLGLSAFAPLGQSEVKRLRGKQQPLTAAGVQGLRAEYTRTHNQTHDHGASVKYR